MDELLNKINDLIREDIESLEKEKVKLNNQIKKLTTGFDTKDIDKLNKLSNEVNAIQYSINRFYMFLGSMYGRMK